MYDNNSFIAIDRLVDFAKGTAIQEQMTKSMNETIENMRIPGAGNPMPKNINTENHEEGKSNES